MNNTRIQLIGDVTGYLDLKEGTAFPINISISDIRDISKRNGSYSKTITLIGNHNNNKLLGNIFDINIVDGSFNINTLQECLVEQDGVVILDNMYIQLTSIKKVQPDASYDYDIEYEVEIKDSSSDFFTKIQNLELTDLDLRAFNHVYEIASITQSFYNTYVDGYKYLLPYNDTPNYIIQDFKPAVYNRIYWDQIFDNAGYTYTFDEQDNLDIRFNELIIPYNGDKPKPIEDQSLWVVADKTTPVTLRVVESLTYPGRVPIILDNEISDPSNFYNPTLGEYTVPFDIVSPDSYVYEFKVNYDFYLYNQQAFDVLAYGNLPNKKYGLKIFCNNNSSYGQLSVPQNLVIPSGTTYSLGTNIEQVITINSSDLLTGDIILNYFNTWTSNNQSQVWIEVGDVDANQRRITNEITINSIEVTIKPSLDTFSQGSFLTMNSFVPKKVKQSDYIKSICQMFNLYLETDKDDITNIIIRTRDEFYDSGEVKNWSDKLAKDSDQNIKFLPELSNKKVILTYKDDKDTLNSNYKNIINETYGQIEYEFENDYIRNIERKEIIFSPTPVLYTDFQAVVPSLVGIAPNCNIRILLDNGVKDCLDWTINATQSSAVTLDYYPLLSHFAGDPENPIFDINYGTCDFYFYNPDNIEIIKRNNLYFSHWERTLNQINNGKLLTVSFELDAIDILNLKLNDKIFIDNSYWNINKVIDYDPNSNNLTRVELISIDDDLELPDIIVKNVYQPVNGDIELVDKGKLTNGVGKTKWIYTNIDASNGKTEIKGIQNQTSNLTSGYIDGDRNIYMGAGYTEIKGSGNTSSSPAFIWGNSNTIGDNLENVFVFTNGYTATESNTMIIPNNLILDGLSPTINGVEFSDLNIWERVGDDLTSVEDKIGEHSVSGDVEYSFIVGGKFNSILGGSGFLRSCAIIGGEGNTIDGATGFPGNCVIVGGAGCTVEGMSNGAVINSYYSTVNGFGTIINSQNSNISSFQGSVILGGDYITASADDTVYVPYLNIQSVPAGTPVKALGVEANGNVVEISSLPTVSTWAQVLTNGNVSGGTDAIMSTTDVIKSANGGGQIDLDYGGVSNEVTLTTDNGAQGESYIYLTPNTTYLVGGDGASIGLSNNISLATKNADGLVARLGRQGFRIQGRYNNVASEDIIAFIDNATSSLSTNNTNDRPGVIISSRNSTIGAGVVNSVIVAGKNNQVYNGGTNLISNALILGGESNVIVGGDIIFIGDRNNNNIILGGESNTISSWSSNNSIIAGNSNVIDGELIRDSIILGGGGNSISTGTVDKYNIIILGGENITASYAKTVYQHDSYRDASNNTLTTTDDTITDLYTFIPDTNGVWNIEVDGTGFEAATGDTIGVKVFTTFKVIAGVCTEVGTDNSFRNSNFPVGVNMTLDTNGTLIRIRVTGRTGSSIDWRSSVTITK